MQDPRGVESGLWRETQARDGGETQAPGGGSLPAEADLREAAYEEPSQLRELERGAQGNPGRPDTVCHPGGGWAFVPKGTRGPRARDGP